jgi:uncharacterized protein
MPSAIYVDAAACPVKDEVYKVAARHGLEVVVVSNRFVSVPRDPAIRRVIVDQGPDVADDWIAGHAARGDIVVTEDVPLAGRCVRAGAVVITSKGRVLTESSIGMALATRNLMDELRGAGQVTGGPAPFSHRDRSAFLSALHQTVTRLKRSLSGPGSDGI